MQQNFRGNPAHFSDCKQGIKLNIYLKSKYLKVKFKNMNEFKLTNTCFIYYNISNVSPFKLE